MTMPATAVELQKLLEQRNLYPWYAAANGTEPHNGHALVKEGNKWVVYDYGPGTIPDEQTFDDEAQAVANLIDRLRRYGFADYLKDV